MTGRGATPRGGEPIPQRPLVHLLERVSSTNDVAKAHPNDGRVHLFVAEEQSGGRGRTGVTWHSPRGGLWFSLLVPGKLAPAALTPWHYLAAAVSVLRAVPEAPLEVKWPNDLLLGGKKVGGILVELEWMGDRLERLVVGVGLNTHLDPSALPAGLGFPATTFRQEGFAVHHDRVLSAFWDAYRSFLAAGPEAPPAIREEANARLAFRGRSVVLGTAEGEVEGVLEGVGEEGRLLVRTRDGVCAFTVLEGRGLRARPDGVRTG